MNQNYDYFDAFLNHEDVFRSNFEDCYYSRPTIYDKEDSIVSVAPWGEPGMGHTIIIMPYSHYVSITAIKKKNVFSKAEALNWLFEFYVLMSVLKENYQVSEYTDELVPFIKIEIPDLLDNKKKYNRFLGYYIKYS